MFDRLFRGDAPQGTAQDAFRLLQEQKIDQGRELLRRLLKHEPANVEALALGLFEVTRPPKDGGEARRRAELLARLDPHANENLSIFVCATWTDPSDLTFERFGRLFDSQPRCIHGHAFRGIASIAMSDVAIQSVLRPGQTIDTAYVTYALKGVANLELRNHSIASECFSSGAREADAIPGFYADRLGVPMPAAGAAHLVERYRLLCRAGMALTLRDQGRSSEARDIFRQLAVQDSPIAGDCQVLANENPG